MHKGFIPKRHAHAEIFYTRIQKFGKVWRAPVWEIHISEKGVSIFAVSGGCSLNLSAHVYTSQQNTFVQ